MTTAATTATRPLPIIDEDNRPFWAACRRHELHLQQCSSCASFRYYPGPICPECGSLDFEWKPVSGRGTVYTFTVMNRAAKPEFAAEVPYVYAVVQLDEGPMMTTNIIDVPHEDIKIGLPVRVCYRDLTDEVSLPMFGPLA